MNLKRIIVVTSSLALAVAGATVGGLSGMREHERIRSGLPNLGLVSCMKCHERGLDSLPWAKPRPHHDSPDGIAVSPDGRTLFIALSDRDEVAEADVASLAVTRRLKVPGGPFGLALDTAGIAASPDGRRAYVASGGADVVTVLDLDRLGAWLDHAGEAERGDAPENMALSYRYVAARIPTGCNPQHLALSPDGSRLFIAERLDDGILVVDTTSLKPAGRIILGDRGLDDPIRLGERVFTRARYSFQGQFSCRSCHPDGHVDGLSYDFDGAGVGDNLLANRSLCGVAGTEPFKWNGKNPTLQYQDGPRFARVLMRTDEIPQPQLDQLATYIKHLPPTRTVPWSRVGQPLTPSEERGRKLFFATRRPDGTPIPFARQCQTCHRPPLFTNRLMTSVGTQGAQDSSGVFDTPHLIGVGAMAPYLHDGRARTLEEIWTVYQKDDLHGVSSYWSKEQLNDLVEYLKTI